MKKDLCFKIGDVVTIRDDLKLNEKYYLSIDSPSNGCTTCIFCYPERFNLRGKRVQIKNVRYLSYKNEAIPYYGVIELGGSLFDHDICIASPMILEYLDFHDKCITPIELPNLLDFLLTIEEG